MGKNQAQSGNQFSSGHILKWTCILHFCYKNLFYNCAFLRTNKLGFGKCISLFTSQSTINKLSQNMKRGGSLEQSRFNAYFEIIGLVICNHLLCKTTYINKVFFFYSTFNIYWSKNQ